MRIAFEIGIEPYEVRLRNLVQPEKMTARAETGKNFDSGDHPECIHRAVRRCGLYLYPRTAEEMPRPTGG